MSGVLPVYDGPQTFEVTEAVIGGQLVEGRAASKIGVAAAGSMKVLGVATKDAIPTSTDQNIAGAGTNMNPKGPHVAVDHGKVFKLKYAAAANFGDVLISAADGQVTPAGADPDARTIVGRCTDPAGVASGALGLTYIN